MESDDTRVTWLGEVDDADTTGAPAPPREEDMTEAPQTDKDIGDVP